MNTRHPVLPTSATPQNLLPAAPYVTVRRRRQKPGHPFDVLTRALRVTPTRRNTLRGLGALGLATMFVPDQAPARIKRKDGGGNKNKNKSKKKKGRRCASEFPRFCPGLGCCPANWQCCAAGCAQPGYQCCAPNQGGGSCPIDKQCCGPTPQSPQGSCVAEGTICCGAANGGACPTDLPVCCPAGTGPQAGPARGCCQADFPICCPAESNACAPEGGSCCTAAQGGGSCGPGEQCSNAGCVPA
jgi:hypothetical protein